MRISGITKLLFFSLLYATLSLLPLNAQSKSEKVMIEEQDRKKLEELINKVYHTDYERLLEIRKTDLDTVIGKYSFAEFIEALQTPYIYHVFDPGFISLYSTLGIAMHINDRDELVMVNRFIKSPMDNYPLGTIIRSIDGKDSLDTLLKLIKEKKRDVSNKEPLEIVLEAPGTGVQDTVEFIPDVRIKPWFTSDYRENTHYLRVHHFIGNRFDWSDRSFVAQLYKILNDAEEYGVKNRIIDLRGNSGGLLHYATTLIDPFIKIDDPYLTEVTYDDEGKLKKVTDKIELANFYEEVRRLPTAILVDRGTASASEIVAGAVEAFYDSLVFIAGEFTYGKGTVMRGLSLNSSDRGMIYYVNSEYLIGPFPEGTDLTEDKTLIQREFTWPQSKHDMQAYDREARLDAFLDGEQRNGIAPDLLIWHQEGIRSLKHLEYLTFVKYHPIAWDYVKEHPEVLKDRSLIKDLECPVETEEPEKTRDFLFRIALAQMSNSNNGQDPVIYDPQLKIVFNLLNDPNLLKELKEDGPSPGLEPWTVYPLRK